MELIDTLLVITDALSDHLLQVWHILIAPTQRRQAIAQTGAKGRGPKEFLSPLSIRVENDSAFWIYDNTIGRLSRYVLSRVMAGPDSAILLPPMLAQTAWRGDTLLANGMFAPDLIRKYRPAGGFWRAVAGIGRGPFPNRPPLQQPELQRTVMAVDSTAAIIAVAFMNVDRIYIYDRAGTRVAAGSGNTPLKPIFRFTPAASYTGGLMYSKQTKWAYKDIVIRGGRIYALFSGRSQVERDGPHHAAREIHVFDLDGHLVNVWTLDTDVRAIAVGDSLLYGAAVEPYPDIVVFRIPLDGSARE